MIPVYVFYSMFGFQRTADGLWAAADQMAKGFLLGATAGRTTLNGEGLQHADGHSLLIAATNPAVLSYDPAFAFETAHIVEDGLRRMDGESPESIFYYLTVYNEPILQPAEPADLDVAGLLRRLYRYAPARSAGPEAPRAQLLASGTGMQWALRAQELLAQDWGVAADVWSATSWTELRRDAVAAEEHNQLHPGEEPRVPYVTSALSGTAGRSPPGRFYIVLSRSHQRVAHAGRRPTRCVKSRVSGHPDRWSRGAVPDPSCARPRRTRPPLRSGCSAASARCDPPCRPTL